MHVFFRVSLSVVCTLCCKCFVFQNKTDREHQRTIVFNLTPQASSTAFPSASSAFGSSQTRLGTFSSLSSHTSVGFGRHSSKSLLTSSVTGFFLHTVFISFSHFT